jgi:hypothetical protein
MKEFEMSIVSRIAQSTHDAEQRAAVGDICKIAALTALHGKGAAYHTDAQRGTERVQRVLKTTTAPVDSVAAGAGVADIQQLSAALSTSLVGTSVFDTVLAGDTIRLRSQFLLGVDSRLCHRSSRLIALGAPR